MAAAEKTTARPSDDEVNWLSTTPTRQEYEEDRRASTSSSSSSSSGDSHHGPNTLTTAATLNRNQTLNSVLSKTVISFSDDDPENPYNFPKWKKWHVVLGGLLVVFNSTLGSSLPSGAQDLLADSFGITSHTRLVLSTSMYLVGYIFGPLLFGPLSEQYGRRPLMTTSFTAYVLFTLACALATNYPMLLAFRALSGMVAAAPIAIVGGQYADVYCDPVERGKAMAWFMTGTTLGPDIGPIVSGYLAMGTGSWRWPFWFGLIFACCTWPLVVTMPETYAPTLLAKRAAKMRKETGRIDVFAPLEVKQQTLLQVLAITLTRPFRMIWQESIVLFTSIYVSLTYALLYLYLQAYPIVFQGVYGLAPGPAGLAFLPILVGTCVDIGIFFWWDAYLQKAKRLNKSWAFKEEFRRLPLACLGGPMMVVALFWLGWTSTPSISLVVPMMSGLLFGMGYLLIFMAMLNYLTDAYETLSASAQAAASTSRSCWAAVLPLATQPMYSTLGVSWATSLLGFATLGVAIIPFAFIKWGEQIRAGSKFCQEIKEAKRLEKEREERQERHFRRMAERQIQRELLAEKGKGKDGEAGKGRDHATERVDQDLVDLDLQIQISRIARRERENRIGEGSGEKEIPITPIVSAG